MSNNTDSGDTQHLSELRIVLMGHRKAGKSSSGNTILGREEFDLKRSAQCVKRHGDVGDKHVTVIETPGWWRNVPVQETHEILKQEILLSMDLCPPGPHAILLVIRADTKFEEYWGKISQGFLDLLGERVWSHTMVLFTYGDCLDTSIEQHIESEGQPLQCLLDKCGNRYHLLNNQDRSDTAQIKELLEKIEETVARNNGCHFELDRTYLEELKERRRAEKERAEERMKVTRQNSQMSEAQHLSEVRIVLIGNRAAGKSSSGNNILGRKEFDLKRSAQGVKRHGDVGDKYVTVIEAPGWRRNKPIEENSGLLKSEILLSMSLCPPGPHVILLVLRADSRFKETEIQKLKGFLDLLGERVWSHTIVLFTYGDSLVYTSIEQHIESEGQSLQCLLDKCGNRYHLLNNQDRSDIAQIKELLEKIEEMVAQNNGCHIEDNTFLQIMKERKREEERADERMRMAEKQRKNIRSQMSEAQHLSEVRIVLMGYRGAGKSSSGNTILGREEFDLKRSAQCVKRHGDVGDKHVTVIEAPGWWINIPVGESPEILKQEILLSMSLCPPGPHAILLVIRADTCFKMPEINALHGHLYLLGESVWNHIIVLFTCGDSLVDASIEQHIESEGQPLQGLLDKCGNRYHLLNNQDRSDITQIKELLEKIEETVALNKCHLSPIEIQAMNTRMTSNERIKQWRKDFRSQMMNECKLSHTWAPGSFGSFRSQSEDNWSIIGSSHSPTKRYKSMYMYNSIDLITPLMSGHERLHTLTLGSSGHGSFTSEADSGSLIGSSSHLTDSSRTKQDESGVPKINKSMDGFPPLMSEDKKLNPWYLGSSDYGSFGAGAESRSFFRSSPTEDSTHSTDLCSVQHISESVQTEGAQDVP